MNLRWSKAHSKQLLTWASDRARKRFKDMPPQQLQDLIQGMAKSRKGTLNVMVQSLRLRWSTDSVDAETCILPPVALERTNAENIMAALDHVVPALSIDRLAAASVADSPAIILMILMADAAGANERLKRWVESRTPGHVAVLSLPCAIHQVHRVIRVVLISASVLSPMYCLGHLLQLADVQTRLLTRVAVEFVKRFDYVRAGQRDDSVFSGDLRGSSFHWRRIVLDCTLLRERACRAKAAASFPQPANAGKAGREIDEVANKILAFFNGQWLAQDRILHQCAGCCSDKNDALAKGVKLVCDALLDRLPAYPALSRWTSTQSNVAWWALASALHNLVVQSWLKEWPVSEAVAEAAAAKAASVAEAATQAPPGVGCDAADSGWRVERAERTARGSGWLEHCQTRNNLILLAVITLPIDHMIEWLSSADDPVNHDKLLRPLVVDMVRVQGPVVQTVRWLYLLATVDDEALGIVLKEMGRGDVCGGRACAAEYWRSVVWACSMAAGVFVRFLISYNCVPMSLFQLLDQDLDDPARHLLAAKIWAMPRCCQAVFFQRVRATLRLTAALDLLEPSFLEFLQAAAGEVGVTIAEKEREHAENRSNSTGAAKAPRRSLEWIRYRAVLQAWSRAWSRQHPQAVSVVGALTSARLLEKGVRTRGRQRTSSRAGVGGSAWLLFRSSRLKGHTSADKKTALLKRRQRERAIRTAWLDMSPAERNRWQATFSAKVASRQSARAQSCGVASVAADVTAPRFSGPWRAGDNQWPLAATRLQETAVGLQRQLLVSLVVLVFINLGHKYSSCGSAKQVQHTRRGVYQQTSAPASLEE
jgi:hypothetical protein